MTAPVFRPNFEKAIKDVHDRVKILEANPNGGTITEITSTGGTVAITNPFGPVTNLETTGGGGMVATDWEFIHGGNGSIASSTFPLMQWVHDDGQTYLDYSTSTVPEFIAGGVYAVTINAYFDDTPPGSGIGVIQGRFEVTYASGSSAFIMDGLAPLRGASHVVPAISFSWTGGVDAGDVMELFLGHTAGVSATVAFYAFIQKLS